MLLKENGILGNGAKLVKHRTGLVTEGFHPINRVEYKETFARLDRFVALRLILYIVAPKTWSSITE